MRQDSWVYVMKNVLKELNKVRDDLYFTILTTHKLKELEFENTEQKIITLPSYPNSMRTHFNYFEVSEAIDLRHNDYDIVWTHLPEHTLQLKNLILNTSNCNPVFIGYSHWWEFKASTFYDQTMINQNLIGLLEMDICGVNCQAQKELVIETSKELLNEVRTDQLRDILTPQYLGSEDPIISKKKFECKHKIIVWNHRVHNYKGWDFFKDCMNKLWEERQDFRLWVSFQKDSNPQRSGLNPEMLDETTTFERDDYYSKLSQSHFGVACNSKFKGWNVSATDALSVGLPYLLFDSGNFRELGEDSCLYFKTKKDLLYQMNTLLDNDSVHNKLKSLSLKRATELRWENQIPRFSNMFDTAVNKLMKDTFDFEMLIKIPPATTSLTRIFEMIKSKKTIKKNDLFHKGNLNWSKRITFQKYRNTLRKHYSDCVEVTKSGYNWIK